MSEASQIHRRHVFYLSGYDPEGAPYYHRRLGRELKRALKIWPIKATISDLMLDDDGVSAHWRLESKGPNWRVETSYEFLGWDDLVRNDMRRPLFLQLLQLLSTVAEYLGNGTLLRIFRANWRFGLFYVYTALSFLAIFALPTGATALFAYFMPFPAGALIGLVAAIGLFVWLRKRAKVALQLAAAWIWFGERANGRRPDLTDRLDRFARRIIAKAGLNDVDEVLVIGHSGGGTISVSVMARALAIDPDFAGCGAPVTLLVLGSSLPLAALHPNATDVRGDIARLARETSFSWVDCQARKDVMNFENFDMVRGCGVDPVPGAPNPLQWIVRFREVIAPDQYARVRWNFGRMHFQFVMSNDRRGAYDYLMFVCGPAPLPAWVRGEALARFSPDAAYRP